MATGDGRLRETAGMSAGRSPGCFLSQSTPESSIVEPQHGSYGIFPGRPIAPKLVLLLVELRP